jgi:hypothetical protein
MDTRRLQHFLGHASITNTLRYTAMSPEPFKDIWRGKREASKVIVRLCDVFGNCLLLRGPGRDVTDPTGRHRGGPWEGLDQTPKAAARFGAIEMPLIMADVAIINWGSDQYACRIRA